MLAQATEADIAQLDQYQSDAFGTLGIQVGPPAVVSEWYCQELGCEAVFTTKQAMRMHQVQAHGGHHVAHLYANTDICRNCLRAWGTRSRAVAHLKTSYTCLNTLRLRAPQGWGHGTEEFTGLELRRRMNWRPHRIPGPLPAPLPRAQLRPYNEDLPPAPRGYLTPEEVENIEPNPDHLPPSESYGSLSDMRRIIADKDMQHNLHDITPHLGPLRVALLLYGGRRREGDIAQFIEQTVCSSQLVGIQVKVCVIDVVHGSEHDISRGATIFWEGRSYWRGSAL